MVAIGALLMTAIASTLVSATPIMGSSSLAKRQNSAGGSCDAANFAPITVVGGQGTSVASFCESAWGTTNLPITAITMWSNTEAVTGLQLTYSDGSQSPILGGQAVVEQTHVAGNNIWSQISMWTDQNEFVRHLLLRNSVGAVINGGELVRQDANSVRSDQALGSGQLFGVMGTTHANGRIASLGFLFQP